MTSIISSDSALPVPKEQKQHLNRLVGAMLPGDETHPAGNASGIFAALINRLASDPGTFLEGLAALQSLCQVGEELTDDGYLARLEPLRERVPAFVNLLQNSLLASYYQDPAVLSSIGVAPRPPFPEGRTVSETDWSLLDPVRARVPFYRDVP